MVKFILNGQQVETDKQKSLLDFLRDDLKITSVKDGCSMGACGTCSVLVDGVSRRACTQKLSRLEGKSIITLEGLSQAEQDVYSFCFAKAGAVQCGFCIPGMIISAKALLDKTLNPTLDEIKKALKGNICRCTGYVKIFDAVLMSAKYFKDNIAIENNIDSALISDDIIRPDAIDKALAKSVYVDDITMDGMVYAKAVRTKYPRAKVLDIDIRAAEKHSDAIKIITADDIPGAKKCGHIVKDWDVLIAKGDITRYVGDSVALVVSKTKESLDEICGLVDVSYEELIPMTSPSEALKPDAPKIHEGGNVLTVQHMKRGVPVDKVFASSKHVVTKTYSTPFTEHAFMEPECAIAYPDGDKIQLFTGGQNVFDEQREIAPVLGIEKEKVCIKAMTVGGGFGGKEDMSVQHHAALAAFLTKKCVKVKLSRAESLLVHPKRHAMEITMTTACDENGKLTAIKAELVADTGAYASLGGPVLQRACTHAAGPYNYQNVDIKGTGVYTNNVPAGAFRGFGVTQSAFAIESNLHLLAEMAGISDYEIRKLNAIRPNQILPNGQIADNSTALYECLLKLEPYYKKHKTIGVACALKNSGLGVGVPDVGRCTISVEDGKVHIRTGAARIGQGLDAVIQKIACQTLNISPDQIIIEQPNTVRTPNSGTTTASRQTVFTGEAVRVACKKLKAELSEKSFLELEGFEHLAEYSFDSDPITSTKKNPVSHVAYGYAVQMVALDDDGKIEKVYAAHDVGNVISKTSCEGQIEGGIIMGLGYALTEDFPLENSVPKVNYAKLGLFKADMTPDIDIFFIEKNASSELAYGAKGVGEIATIPTTPAVTLAYYKLDGQFRTKLPIENTPYSKKR
jgi:aldehyde oxidoreductase